MRNIDEEIRDLLRRADMEGNLNRLTIVVGRDCISGATLTQGNHIYGVPCELAEGDQIKAKWVEPTWRTSK